MYLHNKNNMSHFCITNKKKQKTSIFIFDQWIFWHIVIIVILVIIFILPGSHVITLFGGFYLRDITLQVSPFLASILERDQY
ncbi:membrane protein [Escherichia coli]|uniref:Membrane protein n=1 Tax=Escherichia coli TaxID=562 RepID=A0A376J988_ECOLX|nr:membrane protein [Escherichia coli]